MQQPQRVSTLKEPQKEEVLNEDKDDDEESLLLTQYKEEPYRFCILVLYGLFAAVVGSSYAGYSAIAPQVQLVRHFHLQLYNLTTTSTNLISSAYLTMSLIFVIPSTYILSYTSIRTSIIFITVTITLGAWLRCLINIQFVFAVIGQYVFAISYAFLRSIVTRLSAIWFRPDMRPFTTSLMLSIFFSFDILSLYFPTLFVNVDEIRDSQIHIYKRNIFKMHFIQAIITTAIGLLSAVFFKQKPNSPVSPTATMPRFKFTQTLKQLFCNRDIQFLCIFVAITDSMLITYRIIMRDAFKNFGITSRSVGIFSILSVPATLVVVNLFGYFAGKLKTMKPIMMFLGFSTLFVLLALVLLLPLKSAMVFGSVQVILQILALPCATLSFEMAAQISFPVPEGFSASFANFYIKLTSFILIQISSPFISNNHISALFWLYFGIQAASCVLGLFVREQFNRRNLDTQISKQQKRRIAEGN